MESTDGETIRRKGGIVDVGSNGTWTSSPGGSRDGRQHRRKHVALIAFFVVALVVSFLSIQTISRSFSIDSEEFSMYPPQAKPFVSTVSPNSSGGQNPLNNNLHASQPINLNGSNWKATKVNIRLCTDCQQNKTILEKDQEQGRGLVSCYSLVKEHFDASGLPSVESLRMSQAHVAQNNPGCIQCSPSEDCQGEILDDVGFDEAAPKIVRSVTPTLKSIPSQYLVPPEVLADHDRTKAFFLDNATFPPGQFILQSFNPSIVPAPPNIVEEVGEKAAYLASFRLSPATGCLGEVYPFWKHIRVSYLGLAILDTELNILFDTIVDINAGIFPPTVHEHHYFEDCRLFYLKLSKKNVTSRGELYVSSSNIMTEIHVSTRQNTSADNNYPILAPNLSGDTLFLRGPDPNATFVHFRGARKGKNWNFFGDPSSGDVLLEDWVEAPREVHNLWPNVQLRMRKTGHKYTTEHFPIPAFAGHEELAVRKWRFRYRGRGSACCGKLDREFYKDLLPKDHPVLRQYTHLLFGFAHVSSLSNRLPDGSSKAYVTRLYAFAPEADYQLVARSGMFCFGFTEENEKTDDPFALPSSTVPRSRVLKLHKSVYNCPKIGFVSGMAEAATGEHHEYGRIIVAYGVNDCSSRFVVLDKRSVAETLFLPPSQRMGR